MKRPLSRNRRLAVVAASCSSILATSPVLLGLTGAHSGFSDFARGLAFGLAMSTSVLLLVVSLTFLKRDRTACSGVKA